MKELPETCSLGHYSRFQILIFGFGSGRRNEWKGSRAGSQGAALAPGLAGLGSLNLNY